MFITAMGVIFLMKLLCERRTRASTKIEIPSSTFEHNIARMKETWGRINELLYRRKKYLNSTQGLEHQGKNREKSLPNS